MVAGSVWSQQADTLIGITVSLDGKPIGSAMICSNTAVVHRAVVPTFIPIQLPFGAHTLTLTAASAATIADVNDFFDAVLLY
jgi:hypothetical protein